MNQIITDYQFYTSCVLIAVAVIVRWFAVRYVGTLIIKDKELSRRWLNGIRNTVTTVVVFGLVLIWLSELRFVALSVAAFAVAFIIATREFIQCFLGAIYQTSSRAFSVGDWIKVGSYCGEVVSTDWITTKLLEVDLDKSSYAYTGRTIVVPNNMFISSPTTNLNFMRRYVVHSFTLTREADHIDVFSMREPILNICHEYCSPFEEVSTRYNSLLEKKLGVVLPGAETSVRITTSVLGKNEFTITIFCPTEEVVNVEQKITEDFMAIWYQKKEQLKISKEAKDAISKSTDMDGDTH